MMEHREDIEMQLWAYIDGLCEETDKRSIEELIKNDLAVQRQYQQLLQLNRSLQKLEPEHTSMRFSKNVMEALTNVKPAKPTKSYVNTWVIRSIAAVFTLLIVLILIYALKDLNWKNMQAEKSVDYTGIFNNNFVIYVVLANILLLIFFFDRLLKKLLGKH
jgi:anti-sigma-K factor RskA